MHVGLRGVCIRGPDKGFYLFYSHIGDHDYIPELIMQYCIEQPEYMLAQFSNFDMAVHFRDHKDLLKLEIDKLYTFSCGDFSFIEVRIQLDNGGLEIEINSQDYFNKLKPEDKEVKEIVASVMQVLSTSKYLENAQFGKKIIRVY
jgi:hypothetical protein